MLINHASRQVTAKIVYYGAGLSGKTTNLQYIFSVTNPRSRGELVSMETEIERTIFFDLLPMNVGTIKSYQTKFQLYTVPGQVFYDSTRKLVLRGADGIVFVVDSQELMRQANLESLDNLRDNIGFYGGKLDDLPLVYQYNKRDLKSIMSVEQINQEINPTGLPFNEAVAKSGQGVVETLRLISNITLVKIRETLELVDNTSNKSAVSFDMQSSSPSEHEFTPVGKMSTSTPPILSEWEAKERGNSESVPASVPKITEEPAEVEPAVAKIEEKHDIVEASLPVEIGHAQSGSEKMQKEEIEEYLPEIDNVFFEEPAEDIGVPEEIPHAAAPEVKIPEDGIIQRSRRLAFSDSSMHVEVLGPDGRLLTSFDIDIPNHSRKVNIVLDLER